MLSLRIALSILSRAAPSLRAIQSLRARPLKTVWDREQPTPRPSGRSWILRRRSRVGVLLYVTLMSPTLAHADSDQYSTTILVPAAKVKDSRGVNLITGLADFPFPPLSIGPVTPDHLRQPGGTLGGGGSYRAEGLPIHADTVVHVYGATSSSETDYYVISGPDFQATFSSKGSTTNLEGESLTTAPDGQSALFTARDGSTYLFPDDKGQVTPCPVNRPDPGLYSCLHGYPSQITHPNGEVTTYSPTLGRYSNLGWALFRAGPLLPGPQSWTALNYAYETGLCDPTNGCSTSNGWPTQQFLTNSSPVTTFVDQAGGSHQTNQSHVPSTCYFGSNMDTCRSYYSYTSPAGRRIDLVTDVFDRVLSYTELGNTWNYSYSDTTFQIYQNTNLPGQTWTHTVTVTDPAGRQMVVVSDSGKARVLSVQDELGRVTSYQYQQWRNPTRIIYPEGNEDDFLYDSRGNPVQLTKVPKPGGGLSNIVITAIYPTSCTNKFTCNKPTSITDANGRETDFTYDPTHGGILTKTLPPDSSGIYPVYRYSYVQRYAWTHNGSSDFVRASTPVWVLDSMRTCRTSQTVGNGCAGGTADEVAESYDYGPDAGPNNLLVRGKTVFADGQTRRECYGYDRFGNQIWKTRANAGLTACQ